MLIPSRLACPLALGLGDGRIRDEQLSASSELDDNHDHSAKQGRASLISPGSDRYRAADRESQYHCNKRRTKKKLTTSKNDFREIIDCG